MHAPFKTMARIRLLMEMGGIFLLIPLILVWIAIPWGLILWLACVGAWVWLQKREHFQIRDFWYGPDLQIEKRSLFYVIRRFLIGAAVLIVGVWVYLPAEWMQLPRHNPLLWLAIVWVYPLLSVYPQELLFRAYFLRRYRACGIDLRWLQAINALLFGLAHLLFGNWLAVVLSGIGGWFFADTYVRTRSLRLVWLEHSLYGLLIFTIGLGPFFISGRLL